MGQLLVINPKKGKRGGSAAVPVLLVVGAVAVGALAVWGAVREARLAEEAAAAEALARMQQSKTGMSPSER